MRRLTISLDEKKMSKDLVSSDEAYQMIDVIAKEAGLTKEDKYNFYCDDIKEEFGNALYFAMKLVENNYWFNKYINKLSWYEEELLEGYEEDIIEVYEEDLLENLKVEGFVFGEEFNLD